MREKNQLIFESRIMSNKIKKIECLATLLVRESAEAVSRRKEDIVF